MGEVAFEKDGGDDGVLARFNLNFFDLLIPIVVGVGGGSFVIVCSQALRFLFSSVRSVLLVLASIVLSNTVRLSGVELRLNRAVRNMFNSSVLIEA